MIKAVPDELFASLKSLRILDLFNAQLISLPESLSNLAHLTKLDVGNNHLKTLPQSVSKLHKLSTAAFDTACASERSNLRISEWLNLSKNTWTPGRLFPSGSPSLLTRLQSLYLSGCHLSAVPEDIFEFTGLLRLDLSDNKIADLSPRICELSSLKALNLNRNSPLAANIELRTAIFCQLQKRVVEENEGVVVWDAKLGEAPIPAFDSESMQFFCSIRAFDLTMWVFSEEVSFSFADKYHQVSLAVPWGASKYDKMELIDKVRGLVFGAALADAVGLATEFLTKQETEFYYGGPSNSSERFLPESFIRDRHRRAFVPFDWTDDTDQLVRIEISSPKGPGV